MTSLVPRSLGSYKAIPMYIFVTAGWYFIDAIILAIWLEYAIACFISTCCYLLLVCIGSLSLLPAPWVVSEACLHTREREIFGLLVARVVQKVYGKTGPFSHILCSFFRAIRWYIDRADRSRRNKMWQNFVGGCRSSRARQCWQKPLVRRLTLPDADQKWIFVKLRYHCIKTSASPAWIGHGLRELPVGKGRK